MADGWDPRVQKFILGRQERAYRELAEALGFGSDPDRAYRHIARPLMPPDHIDPEKFVIELGPDFSVTASDREGLDQQFADAYERYFTIVPPTKYEDRNRYAIMAMTLDPLIDALDPDGTEIIPRPILATLPSGEVSARVSTHAGTRTRIIFFEHGLMQFFFDFAKIAAWALPTISPPQFSDTALADLSRSYTANASWPTQAWIWFHRSLESYAVEGTPFANPSPIPKPQHNMPICSWLLTLMERFAMGHELAHLQLGHRGEDPQYEEYEADCGSELLIANMASRDLGSWALGLWACDFALAVLDYLEGALAHYQFGDNGVEWVSKTHPEPRARRRYLRERVTHELPGISEVGIEAAAGLYRMTDMLFERFWETSVRSILDAHAQGQRPSPLWSNHIARNFRSLAGPGRSS